MNCFSLMLFAFWSLYFPIIFFTLNSLCFTAHLSVFASKNETDYFSLLKFEESISADPYEILHSWNTSTHFRNWHGITCNSMRQRVIELNLHGYMLKGTISPHVSNLSRMINFILDDNNFYGKIPQELGLLSQLQTLSLANNSLEGEIPTTLIGCTDLKILYLTGNNLIVAENQINGSLPSNMFHTHSNLQLLEIGGNQISGPVPPSITNASILSVLDIGDNHFMGQVPGLEKLQELQRLSLTTNNLGDNSTNDLEFLKTLTNSSKLQQLDISYNNFGGHFPNSLGNLSTQLSQIYLGGNQISGEIPATIGNLIGLIHLSMENNHINGIIPTTFGKFQKIQKLELGGNMLSGEIGSFIGNLSQSFHIGMAENMLEGNIPPSIGNCPKLQFLGLWQNNLRGTIPKEIFNLSSLTKMSLSQNSLTGNISEEVGNLNHLVLLDMSENNLSGGIPETLGECIMLEYLYLQGNSLHGTIPSSLASLTGLQGLDFSRNSLSGSIPNVLQKISFLKSFSVSFNMLDGEVPTAGGIFQNASGLLVNGNKKLCGGILELHLPPCPAKGKKVAKLHKIRLIAIIVSMVAFLVMLSILLAIYWMRTKSKQSSLDLPTLITELPKVTYQSLHNSTDGFSTTNLIGSGNFSFVYKGTFEKENKVVAIKVLNLQKTGANKSFMAECNALKNIKHRNLVQILTCCSSTDYKGQEFKALIFEYMRNGSLEQWLHPSTLTTEHPRRLSLDKRLNIMIDVASGLQYLHHECEQLIIHCDLKPSNVLLDDNMIAHVSDFGIARLLSTINGSTSKQTSTIEIKGTIGYAAPEYGMGVEVSTNGDMYSFGILLLEMLTRRRPTDEIFKDGQNLHNFVKNSLPDNLLQILDPSLVPKHEEAIIEEENNQNLPPSVEKCLLALIMVGLACSVESPKERMSMLDVTRELSKIKKAFVGSKIR